MKLVAYQCKCGYELEDYFRSDEEIPEVYPLPCEDCGGEVQKFNFKNNEQVQKFKGEW